MNVSIIIPVYNEAERLAACLEAIGRQSVAPLEVIVVDNNSSDCTAAVAQSFPFVTLLKEPRQGVVHARNRGFNAARGELIGRIDADTILPESWISQIESLFNKSDISAVSGAPHYYDFALAGLADSVDYRLRSHLARRLGETNFLWGANMAIRRSAWLAVRDELCHLPHMHEDFDLGIHLQDLGHQVIYDESIVAGVSSRRIDTGFRDYVRYSLISPRTYAMHQLRSRFHMYPVLLVCWLAYVPARVIYRAYDPITDTFSLAQFRVPTSARVDPTSNIA